MEKVKKKLFMEQEHLGRLIKHIKNELFDMPEGNLRITHKKGTPMYYLVEPGGKQHYIRKGQEELKTNLAQKKYLQNLLCNAEEQLRAISSFLESISNSSLTDYYQSISNERRQLIKPIILPDELYVDQWLKQEYQGNYFEEGLVEIYTEKGERVRSKSEKIIADILYKKNIPYLYEKPLRLTGFGTVYPDFTILKVAERKEIYLEHLGKMGDPDYVDRNLRKIDAYSKNGIIIGKSLLLTMESSKKPLDIRNVERLAEEMFCN